MPMRVSSAISSSMRAARAASSGSRTACADLRRVRLAEPAALVERLAQDALELGRRRGHQPLGALEAPRLGQRADGRVELLVREHRIGQ